MPSILPEDLLKNPSLLLELSIPTETPITNGYSGKVGAVWRGGEYFIISPNMDYIPEPPASARDSIKTDGRRGDHDHIQWPQLYDEYYCHFSTIPKPQPGVDLKKDRHAILHISFSNDYFVRIPESTVSGLGHLRPDLIDLMRSWLGTYRERCATMAQNTAISKTILTSRLAQSVSRGVEHMANLPMSRNQMRFFFAHYQRCMLEGEGLVSYLLLYQPRMSQDPPDLERAKRAPQKIMGAFFTNTMIADAHWRGAIPVWLILPLSKVGAVRVDKVVELVPSDDVVVLTDDPAHRGVYFEGSTTCKRHWRFLEYARSYLSGSNPFDVTIPTAILSGPSLPSSSMLSASGPIRTKKTQQRAQPYSHSKAPAGQGSSGQDRCNIQHPLLPECLPAWSSALSSVDQNPAKRVREYMNEKNGYAFPDPMLFVTPEKDEKKALYFMNWLKNRLALVYRVSAPYKKSEPILNQLWRDLLNIPAQPGNASGLSAAPTRNQQRRDVACQILADCIQDTVQVADIGNSFVQWRGISLAAGQLPPPDIAREILWELAEMNFRAEIVGLDKRAHKRQPAEESRSEPTGRDEVVGRCFPYGFLSAIPRISCGKQGLAAESWQDRQDYIINFAEVLSTWAGFNEYVVSKNCRILMKFPLQAENMDKTAMLTVESCLASFYTQSFYNFFGRLPIVPRHL